MTDQNTGFSTERTEILVSDQKPVPTKLLAAFVKAQGEMKNPVFDSKNPLYGSRYASLPSVLNAVMPVLHKHGLGMMQMFGSPQNGISCRTILIHHETGEIFDCGEMSMPVFGKPKKETPDIEVKPDPQAFCSASTYIRRYTIQAICGVVGDEDDDGNKASGRTAEPEAPKSGPKPVSRPQRQAKPVEPPPAPPEQPAPAPTDGSPFAKNPDGWIAVCKKNPEIGKLFKALGLNLHTGKTLWEKCCTVENENGEIIPSDAFANTILAMAKEKGIHA